MQADDGYTLVKLVGTLLFVVWPCSTMDSTPRHPEMAPRCAAGDAVGGAEIEWRVVSGDARHARVGE